MGNIYVGDTGVEITLDCGIDVSLAHNIKINVLKPKGSEVQWSAVLHQTDNTKIVYTTVSDDLDESGEYKLQAHLTLGSWTGCGDTAYLTVKPKWS